MENNPHFNEKYLKIIESIAAVAAYQIEGVASLTQQSGEIVGRAEYAAKGKRSVVATYVNDKINIDVYLNIYSGYSVPDLAYSIQQIVIREVQKATPVQVKSVNINVVGIISVS